MNIELGDPVLVEGRTAIVVNNLPKRDVLVEWLDGSAEWIDRDRLMIILPVEGL